MIYTLFQISNFLFNIVIFIHGNTTNNWMGAEFLIYNVVYLRALFYDPFFLFFIHNLSKVLFLNIPSLTCCMLMIRRYTNCLTWMIVCPLFCVEKCVSDVKAGWRLISFKWMKTRRMSYLLLLNKLLICSIFQNSWILMALVTNSAL